MRIGFIGPADGDTELLREAAEFLLGDADVDEAIYLGQDDTLDRVVRTWAGEIASWATDPSAFLSHTATVICEGDAAAIDSLLRTDRALARLSCLRKVPASPARGFAMLDERLITVVYDKDVLDEEDIVNATFHVYGKSEEHLLKRFGPRYFFTPGPLSARRVGMIDSSPQELVLSVFDPAGAPVLREVLYSRRSSPKVTVTT